MKPKFSANALTVLEKRYLKKDKNGKVAETPSELLLRVSNAVASAEFSYGAGKEEVEDLSLSFYNLMANLEFMPNSPTLMNAGRELGQLSACFVLPIKDSMESIFETLKAAALIHKSGGGTGFSFSNLRAKNSMVKSTGGVASGPVSFMKVFDSATQAVKQGGTRRGANMGILRVDHPDILEFIKCKEEEGQISNFNISVAVTDEFMEKLRKEEDYDLIDPHTNTKVRSLNTKEVFDLIIAHAHKNGEPGVIFIDRMNQFNPTPRLGRFESTNPCGEQVLLPYESCNLGSINLSKMLVKEKGGYKIDWDKLSRTVHLSVQFLDNVIDINKFPLQEIADNTRRTRKIGLGIMGWATMLGYLGIPYASLDALETAERVMRFIRQEAVKQSSALAEKKGVFPAFNLSVWHTNGVPVRNSTLTTIAPTGTISIIAGPCSSGIEPIFALVYYRKVLDGEKLMEIDPSFEEVAKQMGFYSQDLLDKIAGNNGTLKGIREVPEDIKRIFATSLEIDPAWHIKMQAAFQKYTDNAVSKTINLPNSASLEDVRQSYLLAYKLGCKGITVYRDKSRQEQVLNTGSNPGKKQTDKHQSREIVPRPRPEVIIGTTTKVSTGCGNLYVTINQDENGRFFEVFTQMGKAGGCAASQLEAIGRLVSLALRSGIEPKSIAEQLKGIRCPSPSWGSNGKRIFSCADAIAWVLEKRGLDQQNIMGSKKKQDQKEVAGKDTEESMEKIFSGRKSSVNVIGVCPECGSALRHEEGCVICSSCGYSRC